MSISHSFPVTSEAPLLCIDSSVSCSQMHSSNFVCSSQHKRFNTEIVRQMQSKRNFKRFRALWFFFTVATVSCFAYVYIRLNRKSVIQNFCAMHRNSGVRNKCSIKLTVLCAVNGNNSNNYDRSINKIYISVMLTLESMQHAGNASYLCISV